MFCHGKLVNRLAHWAGRQTLLFMENMTASQLLVDQGANRVGVLARAKPSGMGDNLDAGPSETSPTGTVGGPRMQPPLLKASSQEQVHRWLRAGAIVPKPGGPGVLEK